MLNLKYKLVLSLCFLLFVSHLYSQNSNLVNLIDASQWDSLFPKRAGTYGDHPQGYSTDFYSFNNFSQAVDEMSDFLVEIKLKEGVWGQLITITRKSNNDSYLYSNVEQWWHDNPTPATTILVDFEDFINRSSTLNNQRELAAFLANISKETTGGWQFPVGGGTYGDYAQWGLYFVHEIGYDDTNSAGAYSQEHPDYPPNPAVGYYGRGPMQLSWNYNYGQLSKFLYNDKNILLDNPNLVQEDGVLAFKSAIWFWMMPQCPKPSSHQVMHDLWAPQAAEYTTEKMYKKGFAHTNNIINGGLECRPASTSAFTEKVILRSELYQYYLEILGLSSSQIEMENTGMYTTLCYESSSNTMEDYLSCFLEAPVNTTELENAELSVYPNPTAGILNIVHSKSIDKIKIINTQGQVVYHTKAESNPIAIDISHLNTGVFTLKIISGNKTYQRKIIKNR